MRDFEEIQAAPFSVVRPWHLAYARKITCIAAFWGNARLGPGERHSNERTKGPRQTDGDRAGKRLRTRSATSDFALASRGGPYLPSLATAEVAEVLQV